jgi:hypothetical protein
LTWVPQPGTPGLAIRRCTDNFSIAGGRRLFPNMPNLADLALQADRFGLLSLGLATGYAGFRPPSPGWAAGAGVLSGGIASSGELASAEGFGNPVTGLDGQLAGWCW